MIAHGIDPFRVNGQVQVFREVICLVIAYAEGEFFDASVQWPKRVGPWQGALVTPSRRYLGLNLIIKLQGFLLSSM